MRLYHIQKVHPRKVFLPNEARHFRALVLSSNYVYFLCCDSAVLVIWFQHKKTLWIREKIMLMLKIPVSVATNTAGDVPTSPQMLGIVQRSP